MRFGCVPTYLTLPTAVPLVATAGAHELGLSLLAALAFWHFVFVELGPVASAGRNNYTRFAMALVTRTVCRSVVVMIVTLIDHQAIHAIVGFVVLERDWNQ